MFKSMLKPGIIAGAIGGIVSIAISFVMLAGMLSLPPRTAAIFTCLGTPVGLLESFLLGVFAAWIAQRGLMEKAGAKRGLVAGLIAGIVSSLVGALSLPFSQAIQNSPAARARMLDIQVEIASMFGAPPDQLEMVRAQMAAQQNNPAPVAALVAGVVIGLVFGMLVGMGGGALGGAIFKPRTKGGLKCSQCGATFKLGENAFIDAQEGRADLIDYCNWHDLRPAQAEDQRKVITQILKETHSGSMRQWQCGMCKTLQNYS